MSRRAAVWYRSLTVVVLFSVSIQFLWVVSAAGTDSTFVDVSGVHQAGVEALAAEGVLRDTECGENQFCPGEPLDRWIGAVWMVRAIDGSDPPGPTSSRFTDVSSTEWWAPYVERLAELGITKGCVAELGHEAFCPDSPITRAQMATFLVRAFALPSADSGGFVDTGGSVHEEDIDALAAKGITVGCASEPRRYCPKDQVTRGQMATFLARALGWIPLPENVMPPPPPQRLAFHSRVSQGVYDVFVADIDGTNLIRLTTNNDTGFPGFHGKPSWSPDGTMVTFRSWDETDGDWEISVAHVDGSGVVQLTDNDWHDTEPAFSSDGRIAYVASPARDEIKVVSPDGVIRQTLIPPVGLNVGTPRWSPDSSRIVISDNKQIWIMNSDGSNPQQLTDNDMWNEEPVWSPDGTRIAFHARTIVYDRDEGKFKSLDDSEIYVVSLADGAVEQLTDNDHGDYAPAWSPDGTRLAFESYLDDVSGYDIFIVDAEGTNQQRLAELPGSEQGPEWSPDGNTIAFARGGGIYMIGSDGTNLRQVTYGSDGRPSWWGPKRIPVSLG